MLALETLHWCLPGPVGRDLQQGKLAIPQALQQADCVFRPARHNGATKRRHESDIAIWRRLAIGYQCVEHSLILLASDRVLAQIATTRPQIWEAVAALLYQRSRDLLQLLAETIALPPSQRAAPRMVRLAQEEGEGGKPMLCLSQWSG